MSQQPWPEPFPLPTPGTSPKPPVPPAPPKPPKSDTPDGPKPVPAPGEPPPSTLPYFPDQTEDPFKAAGGGVKLPNGQWVPKNHPLAAGAAPAPAPPPGDFEGPLPPVIPGEPPDPNAPPKTIQDAFQKALMKRLNPDGITAESEEVKAAIEANRAAEQRAFERARAQTAERAQAQGLDTTAFDTQLRGMAGERAGREAAFEGGVTLDAMKQQAAELTAALELGGSMLTEQQRMALQDKLAQLQAAISREGLALQGELGRGDMSLRRFLGEGQLNLGLLQALLGNDQFLKKMSFDQATWEGGQNSGFMAALMEWLKNSGGAG